VGVKGSGVVAREGAGERREPVQNPRAHCGSSVRSQGSRVGHVHCSHGSSGACITEKLDYVVCPDVLSVP